MEARRTCLTVLLSLCLLPAACRPPGQDAQSATSGQAIEGLDASELTGDERRLFDRLLGQLAAPCDTPSPLGECAQKSLCPVCAPAARAVYAGVRLGRLEEELRSEYVDRFSPSKAVSLTLGDSPSEGPENAGVTVVEWADYQCPHCAHAMRVLDKILAAHPEDVRLVFKQFPIKSHPQAELAARATLAAREQGAFWQLHRKLFDTQEIPPDEARLQQLAQELKLDWEKLKKDMYAPKVDETLARERAQAEAIKLRGTPTLFVNGRAFDLGTYSLDDDLPGWIATEVEIARAKRNGGRP